MSSRRVSLLVFWEMRLFWHSKNTHVARFTLDAAATALCMSFDYLFVASFQSPMQLKAHLLLLLLPLPFCRRCRRRRRVLFSIAAAGTRMRNRLKRLTEGGGAGVG